jgi:hypothetical protein
MGHDFAVGDLVWMPESPWPQDSVGRVVDIRDYGIEIWVKTISDPPRVFYSYYDQFELFSVLDQLIVDDGSAK